MRGKSKFLITLVLTIQVVLSPIAVSGLLTNILGVNLDSPVEEVSAATPIECTKDGAEAWGYSVEDFTQGDRKDRSDVVLARSDETQALGAADGSFFSLGYEGEIVIKFENEVYDVGGDDLFVNEVTNGNYPDETADVAVSMDGTTWEDVGSVSNQVAQPVAFDTGMNFRYVQIKDTTDSSPHDDPSDGFDLESVRAASMGCGSLNITKYECPDSVDLSQYTASDIRPDSNGIADIDPINDLGCTVAEGYYFGYIHESDVEDSSSPFLGYSDHPNGTNDLFSVLPPTNGSGEVSMTGLSFDGRYDIAEVDDTGAKIPNTDAIGLACSTHTGPINNTYELIFPSQNEPDIYCNAFNFKEATNQLNIKKYICENGTIVNDTSFTTDGSTTYTNSDVRPSADGTVNGVPFSQLAADSFPGCRFAEKGEVSFNVAHHPEDTSGAGQPTGPINPVGLYSTDADGMVMLPNLSAEGRYEVVEALADGSTMPDNLILGFACARNGEGEGNLSNAGEYALPSDGNQDDAYEMYCIGFDLDPQGEIEGAKYYDLDRDGVENNNDYRLNEWVITLYDDSWEELQSMKTGDTDTPAGDVGQGEYKFIDLVPGTYYVCEEDRTDQWIQIEPADGEEDPDNDQLNCHVVDLTPGQTASQFNFGNYEIPGMITGRKFRDVNANGIFDQEEEDAPGNPNRLDDWMIYLYDSNWKLVDQMLTGRDGTPVGTVGQGQYRFVDIVPGTYYVCEEDRGGAGWMQSTPTGPVFDPDTSLACHTVQVAAADEITGVHFGNYQYGDISGYKWEDTNGNGEWESGEPTISRWLISLWSGDMDEPTQLLETVATDSDGYYMFEDVQPGIYWLQEAMPDGWVQTFPGGDGPTGELIGPISLGSGAVEEDNNFGNFELGEIVIGKCEDLNGNGYFLPVHNPSENDCIPQPGWEISIYDNAERIGGPIATGTTGNFGFVRFDDLEPGTYYIFETIQDGWVQTRPHIFGREYHRVTIDESAQIEFRFFGNFQTGTIRGAKFDDANQDGSPTIGESVMNGWDVRLYDAGWTLLGTTTTGDFASGRYRFEDVGPGMHFVCEVLKGGWEQTFAMINSEPNASPNSSEEGPLCARALINSSGVVRAGRHFGNYLPGSIHGQKWEDINGNSEWDNQEPVIEGWDIYLWEGDQNAPTAVIDSTVTDDEGYYSFEGLDAGTYWVAEVDGNLELPEEGWQQTFPSGDNDVDFVYGPFEVTSQFKSEGNDFGNFDLGSVTGRKYQDVNGNGEFDDEEKDEVGNPNRLNGWTVRLYDNSWKFIEEKVTGHTGNKGQFTFDGLFLGTYYICEVGGEGWMQIDATQNVINGSGESDEEELCASVTISESGQDFGGRHIGNFDLGEIIGRKYQDVNGNGEFDDEEKDEAGNPNRLDDWIIRLYDDGWDEIGEVLSGHTGAKGQYKFDLLELGTYYVCEAEEEGWVQTGVASTNIANGSDADDEYDTCIEVTISESGQSFGGKHFGNFELAEIHGQKWEDLNGNGEWDSGEEVLEDWTINLWSAEYDDDLGAYVPSEIIETTETDDEGYYWFMNLERGYYFISEEIQEGWAQTYPSGDFVDAERQTELLGNADFSSIHGPYLTTSGMVDEEENDFGNFELGYIQGRKYRDANYNGDFDDVEKDFEGDPYRLDNWTMTLYVYDEDEDEWMEIDSMLTGDDTTDAENVGQGQYRFVNLEVGTYLVCEEDRTDEADGEWTQSEPTSDTGTEDPENDGLYCHEVEIDESGETKEGRQFGNHQDPVLGLDKSDDDQSVQPGETIIYELAYVNNSVFPVIDTWLSDVVPTGTTFDLANSTVGWDCTDNAPAGTECVFVVGALDPGEGGSIFFAVTVDDVIDDSIVQILNEAEFYDPARRVATTVSSDENTPITSSDVDGVSNGSVLGANTTSGVLASTGSNISASYLVSAFLIVAVLLAGVATPSYSIMRKYRNN